MARGINREFPAVRGPGYVVLDTETTGLERDARVIELAAIFLSPTFVVQDRFSTLVRGDGTVGNVWAQRAHRISPDELIHAPSFRHLAGPLLDVIKNRVPIVHNEKFDLARINYELSSLKRRVVPRFGCTLALGREVGYGRLKLKDAIRLFDLRAENSHQAEDDAFAAAQLFKYYGRNYRSTLKAHLEARGYELPR